MAGLADVDRTSFHAPAPHGDRSRRRRQFSLPDGREAHIAASPDEVPRLKERLVQIHPDGSFEVYINGSNEHIEALRAVHKHHETRREALRRQHTDVYTEIEAVREDLDNISHDLRNLSDHGVLLDANFSKFGYAAHLRTYDVSNPSLNNLSQYDSNIEDVKPERSARGSAGAIKIYRKPTVRQYFHKGLLWRGVGMEEVLSFELFVDLLYVGIIAVNGDTAADHPTGENLLHFCITFILAWKLWNDLTLVTSWFETDDILQRIGVLFVISCLFGYTTNVTRAFDTDDGETDTYTLLIGFFCVARVYNGLYFLLQACMAPVVRGFMYGNAVTTAIPSALWFASIYVDMPIRLALILVAIAFDYLGDPLLILFIRYGKYFSKGLASWNAKIFDFYPAINIEHKTERTKQLVNLVFGYSVVALLYQNAAPKGINGFYGKAVLGVVQTFCQNWIYFEVDSAQIHVHAIRRHPATMIIWNTFHLPFIMAEVLSAAALSRLVVANDCPNSNIKDLTALYQVKSVSEIHGGLRWFYCGGLGVSLMFMSIISMTHIHKTNTMGRIRKSCRVAYRVVISIIILCLPLAQSLNSLQLEAVTMSLVVTILLVDLYGMSNSKVSIFSHYGGSKTKYTAHVNAKHSHLVSAMKTGKSINVSELADR